LQLFLHFSQTQQETCAIFSVLNSEYPAGNLVWYNNVHFKRAVIEFLVAEKQAVMRIHKWLKNIYRMSQEERTKLREGVPYVKLYRYNPKHLCPKLNGY